jgi:hypothetical protein
MSRISPLFGPQSGRWRRSWPSKAQEVEGDQRGPQAACLGQEHDKIALPIGTEHDRLAVDQRLIRGEAANRLSDA